MEDNMSATESTSSEGSGSSSNSSQSSGDEHIYDPVEAHLIQLQEYYREVSNIPLVKKALKRLERRQKGKNTEELLEELCEGSSMPPNIPDFPELVPLSENIPSTSHEFRCLEKDELEEELEQFVKRVLAMCGCVLFHKEHDFMVAVLARSARVFLEKFVRHMRMVKDSEDFSSNNGMWDPFETTLRQIGFGGISGLYAFYDENVIKEHAYLHDECLRLHTLVQALKERIEKATT